MALYTMNGTDVNLCNLNTLHHEGKGCQPSNLRKIAYTMKGKNVNFQTWILYTMNGKGANSLDWTGRAKAGRSLGRGQAGFPGAATR